MQESPSSPETLEAVIEFLNERVAPKLSGHDRYALRVATNSLGTVKRECELRAQAEAEELSRLKELLEREGSVDELNRELCKKIKTGELSIENRTLMVHLKKTTIDQLKIDQPNYSGLTYALEQS